MKCDLCNGTLDAYRIERINGMPLIVCTEEGTPPDGCERRAVDADAEAGGGLRSLSPAVVVVDELEAFVVADELDQMTTPPPEPVADADPPEPVADADPPEPKPSRGRSRK